MLIFIDPLRVNLLVFHFTLKNLSDYLLAARMFYNANEVIVKLKKKITFAIYRSVVLFRQFRVWRVVRMFLCLYTLSCTE